MQRNKFTIYTLFCLFASSITTKVYTQDLICNEANNPFEVLICEYHEAFRQQSYFESLKKLESAGIYVNNQADRIGLIQQLKQKTIQAVEALVLEKEALYDQIEQNLSLQKALAEASAHAVNSRIESERGNADLALRFATLAMDLKQDEYLPFIDLTFGDAVYHKYKQTLIEHSFEISGMAKSSNGDLVFYSVDTGWIYTADQRLIPLEEIAGFINGATFSSDGQYFVTYGQHSNTLLWSSEGKLLHTLSGHSDIIEFATFSPVNNYIITCSKDKLVKLWDIQGNFLVNLKGHQDVVIKAALDPWGEKILTQSADGLVKLWDINGTFLKNLNRHNGWVYDMVFSPDGSKIVTCGGDAQIIVWNANGKPLKTIAAHRDIITKIRFNEAGNAFYSISTDGEVKFWSVDGNLLNTIKETKGPIHKALLAPDDHRMLTVTQNGTAKLWDERGNALYCMDLHKAPIISIAFSSDHNYVLTTSKDKTAKLWDLQGFLLMDINDLNSPVLGGTFSLDNQRLIIFTEDGRVIQSALPEPLYPVLRDQLNETILSDSNNCNDQ